MRVDPVPDARALRLELDEDEDDGPLVALIVAELHLGVETALSRSGAHVASGTDALAESLLSLVDTQRADRIIVAGDFKQTIPVTTWQERRDVPRFIARVTAHTDLEIVLGNHDAGLRSLIPKHHDVRVDGPEGVRLGGDGAGGGIGIFHGHAWPADNLLRADELVSAHTHPAVALVDKLGHAHIEPCWVRGPVNTAAALDRYREEDIRARWMTLVPPYNPLLGGAAVNVDGLLGPAGRLMRIEDSDLYLLDGTHLGKATDLPAVPDKWRRAHRAPAEADL